MKRSTALAVSAGMAAAIALMAAGCSSTSPGSSTDGSSSHPVTLTFWGSYGNGGNSTQQDALNKTLIPAFEKANPGITVTYVDIPYDSLLQKLTTSAAGGTLPDLVRSDIGWVPQLAQLGVLTPLSDSMSDFGTLSKATYPGSLSTNKYNGKYYGLPLDTNTRVLITSQKALDAAGMQKPPATFDDLKQMAAKLKGTGVSVFADGGLGGWNIYPWIWSNGGAITNSGLTKATGYLNGDKSVAAIQMLVDLYKEGQIPNLITGNQGATSTSDGLPTGKYATILDGPWMKGIWAGQYKDFQPIYAPVPERRRPIHQRRRRRGHRPHGLLEAPGGSREVHPVHPVAGVPDRHGEDRPDDRDSGVRIEAGGPRPVFHGLRGPAEDGQGPAGDPAGGEGRRHSQRRPHTGLHRLHQRQGRAHDRGPADRPAADRQVTS